MQKKRRLVLPAIIAILLCTYMFLQSGARIMEGWQIRMQRGLEEMAANTFLPSIGHMFEKEEKMSWLEKQLMVFLPINRYLDEKSQETTEIEDGLTYEMILAMQAADAERMNEDLLENQEGDASGDQAVQNADTSEQTTLVSAVPTMAELRDFNYLVSKLYTVDSTTVVYPEDLNVDQLLAKDMHIDTSANGPKVLIFHTHSQEAFADSAAGDSNASIVGMGRYLSEKLNEKGIATLHHDGVYDLIDGKLDRSKAYELSEIGVKEILNQNPSIEVVIDLHRDGVREDLRLVSEQEGKQAAKIMFFNGLSRTKKNGDIAYLENPYKQDNLSFSLQMQLASESMYPGLARKIYLKGYRYSLHMMPKSLLIEAGAQTNTVQEMKNTMDLLANLLYKVLVE